MSLPWFRYSADEQRAAYAGLAAVYRAAVESHAAGLEKDVGLYLALAAQTTDRARRAVLERRAEAARRELAAAIDALDAIDAREVAA